MDTNETPQTGPDAGAGADAGAGTTSGATPGAAPSPDPHAGTEQPRPAGDGFFTWLRGIGISRPSERWIGGVAAGIADRAGIDPLIVRGIFIALAVIGGPGILIYLIGWFLLPDARGRIEAERLVRGTANGVGIAIAAVIGVLVFFPIVLSSGWLTGGIRQWDLWSSIGVPHWIQVLFTVLWWCALLTAAIWVTILIVTRNAGAKGTPGAEQRAAAFAQQATEWGNQAGAWGEKAGAKAEDWGNSFGAKAGAWSEKAGHKAEQWGAQAGEGAQLAADNVNEWTAREREEHRRSKLDPAHLILTFGIALLAGGATALAVLQTGGEVLLSGLIAASAVLGLSIVIAGLRGRRSGALGFWSFVGIVAMIWIAFVPANSKFVPFGNLDAPISSLSAGTASGVGVLAGNVTVDLRELDQTGGTLDVWTLAGNTQLTLPDDGTPVRVEAHTLAGQQFTIYDSGKRTRIGGPFLFQSTGIAALESDRDPVTTVRVWVLAGNTTIDGVTTGAQLPTSAENRSEPTLRTPLILEDAR